MAFSTSSDIESVGKDETHKTEDAEDADSASSASSVLMILIRAYQDSVSAVIGGTRAARRAGIQAAPNATASDAIAPAT
jgi:hypothetical protein